MLRKRTLDLLNEGAPADRVASAFFTEDDASLIFNFIRKEQHAVRIVAKQAHAFIDHFCLGVRKLQLVNGFVK